MDKDTVKGILAKYSPPLSPGQMDEIAEAFLHAVRSERPKRARRKTKEKVAETPSPEKTVEKLEAKSTSKGESQSLNVAGSK